MLQYESKPLLPKERPWRQVASIIAGTVACAINLFLWWWTAPGIWTLATFSPSGPIRPLGFFAALVLSCFGGLIAGCTIGGTAYAISKRPVAQLVAACGICTGFLPALNLVLFFVIV